MERILRSRATGVAISYWPLAPEATRIIVAASRGGGHRPGGLPDRAHAAGGRPWALIKLNQHAVTPRSWRPHLLVFVVDVRTELDLVRFGNWFSQGRGVVTVCKLLVEGTPEAEVVILGLATPERGEKAEYARRLEARCEGLPTVFFVKNAGLFVGDLVLPDEEEGG
jgi:hypothetical protein